MGVWGEGDCSRTGSRIKYSIRYLLVVLVWNKTHGRGRVVDVLWGLAAGEKEEKRKMK